MIRKQKPPNAGPLPSGERIQAIVEFRTLGAYRFETRLYRALLLLLVIFDEPWIASYPTPITLRSVNMFAFDMFPALVSLHAKQ